MAGDLTEERVTAIVDGRIHVLRTELALELSPIKLTMQAHAAQMAEVRASAAATEQGLARLEGTTEAMREQQAVNHAENQGNEHRNGEKLETILEIVNKHLGARDGEAAAESKQDRRKTQRREWARLLLGALSLSGILKAAQDLWTHFRGHR
jgi:hypothetical protein